MRKQVRLGFFLLAMSVSLLGLPGANTEVSAQTVKPPVNTSAPTGINSPEDLVQWMTYYYLHPQPEYKDSPPIPVINRQRSAQKAALVAILPAPRGVGKREQTDPERIPVPGLAKS